MTRQPGSDRTPGPDATDGSGPDAAPDAVGGALDVIDRSIGMYVVRRLTGRGTSKPEEPAPPVVLSADQVAYRIGAVGATPSCDLRSAAEPLEPGAPLVAGTAAAAAAARAAATHPATGGGARDPHALRPGAAAPRERLVRDSGIALLALATIGLVAVVLWPHGPTGEPEQSIFGVNRTRRDARTDRRGRRSDRRADSRRVPVSPGPRSRRPMRHRRSSHARRPPVGQPTPKLPPGATPRPTSRLAPTPTPTAGATPTPTTRSRPRRRRPNRPRRRRPKPTPTPTPEPDARRRPRTRRPTPTPTPDARSDAIRVTVAASRLCYTAAAVSGRP